MSPPGLVGEIVFSFGNNVYFNQDGRKTSSLVMCLNRFCPRLLQESIKIVYSLFYFSLVSRLFTDLPSPNAAAPLQES